MASISFKDKKKSESSSGAPQYRGNSTPGDTRFDPSQYRAQGGNSVGPQGAGVSPDLAYDYNSPNPNQGYNFPGYYQQASAYDQGLEAARQKDLASGTHVYENTYRILNSQPQQQLTPYIPNSLAGRMTANGTQNVGSGYTWNTEALKQMMGFNDAQAAQFMQRPLNQAAYNALLANGVIVQPAQSSSGYSGPSRSGYQGDYSGGSGYSFDAPNISAPYSSPMPNGAGTYPDSWSGDPSAYQMTPDERAARQAAAWEPTYGYSMTPDERAARQAAAWERPEPQRGSSEGYDFTPPEIEQPYSEPLPNGAGDYSNIMDGAGQSDNSQYQFDTPQISPPYGDWQPPKLWGF